MCSLELSRLGDAHMELFAAPRATLQGWWVADDARSILHGLRDARRTALGAADGDRLSLTCLRRCIPKRSSPLCGISTETLIPSRTCRIRSLTQYDVDPAEFWMEVDGLDRVLCERMALSSSRRDTRVSRRICSRMSVMAYSMRLHQRKVSPKLGAQTRTGLLGMPDFMQRRREITCSRDPRIRRTRESPSSTTSCRPDSGR